jgi:hypothetical protein
MCDPNELSIHYYWQEGSLPPPYYYQFNIRVGPNLSGVIELQPDYDFNSPPIWHESFTLDEQTAKKLLELLEQTKAFQTKWQETVEPTVGGSLESAEIAYCGQHIRISNQAAPEQAKIASQIFEAVRAVAPTRIWNDLMVRRQEYIKTYLEKPK